MLQVLAWALGTKKKDAKLSIAKILIE